MNPASIHAKLLVAQIARLSNSSGSNRNIISPSRASLVIRRSEMSGLVWYSGCLLDEDSGVVFCPFNVTLSKLEAKMCSAPFQFTIASLGTREHRNLAFYSIIEFLEKSMCLSLSRGLAYHVRRLTRDGNNAVRVKEAQEYAEFRIRAAKDLPYDDSLLALESFASMDRAA